MNPQQVAQQAILNQKGQEEFIKFLKSRVYSWSKELREWYDYALQSLRFNSCLDLGLTEDDWIMLSEKEAQGLTLFVMGNLINSCEKTTASQFNVSLEKRIQISKINIKLAKEWKELTFQERKEIEKRLTRSIVLPRQNLIKA